MFGSLCKLFNGNVVVGLINKIFEKDKREKMNEPQLTFTEESNLIQAINDYLSTTPSRTYPPIGTWDVSRITDMTRLFTRRIMTDADNSKLEGIGDWDVSNVTIMGTMFGGCISFNQPLNAWGR